MKEITKSPDDTHTSVRFFKPRSRRVPGFSPLSSASAAPWPAYGLPAWAPRHRQTYLHVRQADLCPGAGGGGALPAARRGELGHAGLCSPLPLCDHLGIRRSKHLPVPTACLPRAEGSPSAPTGSAPTPGALLRLPSRPNSC